MATAYNIHNILARGRNADKPSRADPGANGTIIVSQIDRGVVELELIGLRTLEDAVGLGLGTTVICLSQTAGITVAGDTTATIGDGEYVKFVVINNSSGVHIWSQDGGTVSTAQIATNVTGIATNVTDIATVQAGTTTGTTDISAYSETAYKALMVILDAAGILTDDTTT